VSKGVSPVGDEKPREKAVFVFLWNAVSGANSQTAAIIP